MEKFPVIDYDNLKEDLADDLESGFITKDSTLYIIRQKNDILVESVNETTKPIVDYFYDQPKLRTKLVTIPVVKAKEATFAALKILEENNENEAIKASLTLVISDLKDYTAGNNKRNDNMCSLVLTEQSIPIMVYFDYNEVTDELAETTVEKLFHEITKFS